MKHFFAILFLLLFFSGIKAQPYFPESDEYIISKVEYQYWRRLLSLCHQSARANDQNSFVVLTGQSLKSRW